MTRFYLRFFPFLLILFLIPAFLIRAQPYDDHELRDLLMPDNCEMPCFMGIRPDVTTMDDALKLLRGSRWVSKMIITKVKNGRIERLRWTWNNLAPAIYNRKITAEVESNFTETKSAAVVRNIEIGTTFPVIGLYLIWGEPDATDSGSPGRTTANVAY